ncbi:MAG: RagB/SusD family nutrient uptake outer membrane protein [Dysgonamonadaceae bacterium]|nr:RagB/SusD family nutrient uptake outer membrane protein [Dysgonamonadaceae bacterium]
MTIFAALAFSRCDYLDVVPEGTATMDNAFSTRINSEKFFFSCYNYLPNFANLFTYPANVGGDEFFWNIDNSGIRERSGSKIARGQQTQNDPIQNYWDGARDGKNMFIGLRDCNIFLDNIHKVPDLEDYERKYWMAEVKVVKAYIHFFLMQLYGPIPIVKENIDITAAPAETRVYREPVDEVTEYIVSLIDEAYPDLMEEIEDPTTQTGRITQSIAAAIKAKVLIWAASPFNNGNSDYSDFVDNRGVHLYSATSDPAKWKRAADAVKEAIDIAEYAGHRLYEYSPPGNAANFSANRKLDYALRGPITDRFNDEIIWGCTNNSDEMQRYCCPQFYNEGAAAVSEVCATLNVVEQFYTSNGLPITEDPNWDFNGRYEKQKVEGALATWHSDYVAANEITARMNFYREPRFYAFLSFDRALFATSQTINPITIKNRSAEAQGYKVESYHISTGYYVKKLVPFEIAAGPTYSTPRRYSMPVIRLADLYLLYAEALNEVDGPSDPVYAYLDAIRTRAGIPAVKDAYANASPEYRNKPNTKDGMREIIKRERMIELSFEGERFWDLRRWKDAAQYFTEPIRGWNYQGTSDVSYYNVITYLDNRTYNLKHYLWPIKLSSLIVNSNLVQNPGW